MKIGGCNMKEGQDIRENFSKATKQKEIGILKEYSQELNHIKGSFQALDLKRKVLKERINSTIEDKLVESTKTSSLDNAISKRQFSAFKQTVTAQLNELETTYEKEISKLKEIIRSKEQIAKGQIAKLEQQSDATEPETKKVRKLNKLMEKRDREIAELEEKVVELEEVIFDLNAQIDRYKKQEMKLLNVNEEEEGTRGKRTLNMFSFWRKAQEATHDEYLQTNMNSLKNVILALKEDISEIKKIQKTNNTPTIKEPDHSLIDQQADKFKKQEQLYLEQIKILQQKLKEKELNVVNTNTPIITNDSSSFIKPTTNHNSRHNAPFNFTNPSIHYNNQDEALNIHPKKLAPSISFLTNQTHTGNHQRF